MSFLDQPLSSPRPLPPSMKLTPNGSFIYSSLRVNQRTKSGVEASGAPELNDDEGEQSFSALMKRIVPDILPHLVGCWSSRLSGKRLAGVSIGEEQPARIQLVNGTEHVVKDMTMTKQEIAHATSTFSWNREASSGARYYACHNGHRVTWHASNTLLSLRLGRQTATRECCRVVEATCHRWLAKHQLGIVGTLGKTTVAKQLLRTLITYHGQLRVGILSETGELEANVASTTILIPWQRDWDRVVRESKLDVLIVDGDVDARTLDHISIPVAATGWTSAKLVLEVQSQPPLFRLIRR